MIHYQLICSDDHRFDGWFKDSAGFDRQCAAGLVVCPECGTVAVNRALMAPSIPRKGAVPNLTGGADARHVASATVPATPLPALAGGGLPDQVRSVLQRLRAEIEQTCENVGDRFAEEARAIHRGDDRRNGPARGIYGHATPEQVDALADEGIEVAQIPWVPRADG